MRILLTTSTYPPSTNGVAFHTQLLFQELERLGHDVRVLAPEQELSPKEPHVIHYPSISNPWVKDYPFGIPLISPWEIKRFNPEVIHTQHPLIIGQVSVFLANRFNCPLFFTHHTRYQEYIDYYLPAGTKITARIFNQHLKKLSAHCQAVVCPSHSILNQLKKLDITNTVHLPNGIDTHHFKPATTPPNTLSLIYIGRLEAEKQPLKLIELARELKQSNHPHQLTIVGSGRLQNQLEDQVRLHHLNSVKILGNVPRQRLAPLLQKHRLFISFSESEVMPLSYLEAQACGLPIAYPRSTTNDSIPAAASILLPPSLSQAALLLQQTFADQAKLAKLSQASLHNTQNYSITATANKHLNLYTSTLENFHN